VGDTHSDAPEISTDIVNPEGNGDTLPLAGKMRINFDWLFTPISSIAFVVSNQLLLLRVNADDWEALFKKLRFQFSDILKLCVAIWRRRRKNGSSY